MAQKAKKGIYMDGRTYAEVCKPGGIEDCCGDDDGRGNVSVSVAEPGILGTRISQQNKNVRFRRYFHCNFYVDIYSNIDFEVSDMDGSRNMELSSSDNIVSEVCIDSTSYVDLPFEIIYDIFLRLPIEDIVRCKSVCKTWYNLTREPDFISLQANRSALGQSQRILLVPDQYNIDSLFLLDNEKCTKIQLKNLELSHHYRVANCCNGLLCIASNLKPDEPVFIYNPITGECNELPKKDHKPCKTSRPLYGFGFDRFSNKYKVICVYRLYNWGTDYFDPVTMVEIITDGEDSWRKLEFPYQVKPSRESGTVFVDDAFHWMIGSEFILALNINNEKFHTLPLPPVECPGSLLYLINFAGSLAFAEFDVRARDCSSKIWKILSSGETNDRWICECTCKFVSANDRFRYYHKVLGSTDGNLLYQATELQTNEWLHIGEYRETCNQLGVYIPDKKESFLLNMQGSPLKFQTVLFTPTLISPKALHFPWPWSPIISSIKVLSRKQKHSKRR